MTAWLVLLLLASESLSSTNKLVIYTCSDSGAGMAHHSTVFIRTHVQMDGFIPPRLFLVTAMTCLMPGTPQCTNTNTGICWGRACGGEHQQCRGDCGRAE